MAIRSPYGSVSTTYLVRGCGLPHQRARYDSLRAALCAVARLYAPAGAVVRNDMVIVTQSVAFHPSGIQYFGRRKAPALQWRRMSFLKHFLQKT